MFDIKSTLPSLSNLSPSNEALNAAGRAMAELFTAGCIGSTCVRREYLTPTIVQSLSKTCFTILLPMFLCTSIMNTLKRDGFSSTSAAIPMIAITHCLALFWISKNILLPAFQIEADTVEGRATTVCCSFGNSGVVPLIFAEALFRNANDPSLLQKAYSQVSLYLMGWSPLFWSFGRKALLGKSLASVPVSKVSGSKFHVWAQVSALTTLFPPPVIGVMFGLVVSSVPLLRWLVVSSSERKAPFEVIFNCFQNLGRAANPLALLVLTSSLALGNNAESGDADGKIPLLRRWSCVTIARFGLSPTLMFLLLNTSCQLGIIGEIGSDPMTWFILILEACMPCAQNSVVMLHSECKTKEASRLAKFLFAIYITAMIPIVLICSSMWDKCRFY